ncbi:hypothetical protein WJ96_07605 [Burkholderia ubonensis]|uniref:Uncharacterized protein n=1 Tax=Burkholderia ubonensis TaxID=101571 RepID=A0AAW3MUT6_9BURK|nr:hypothetical protein [Burkholderia ubonensis]KVP75565.1 hypothetical protein WJ93_09405 [Burkholderia ubonensis]KVP97028.1 hypothetical protein WJ97_14510 [Burkholderia ubonensis]KVP98377.1 hypothetical protein WJ96_07605 [Burkholderia ubonensis]KVZ93076.1 hypothetical protein WL25_19270 [Burkholderia ubonensis]
MKHVQEVTIRVNGKTIKATVQLDAPGLDVDDCLSPQMILSAVASGQKTEYRSRHHKDRVATIETRARVDESEAQDKPALRLVA